MPANTIIVRFAYLVQKSCKDHNGDSGNGKGYCVFRPMRVQADRNCSLR